MHLDRRTNDLFRKLCPNQPHLRALRVLRGAMLLVQQSGVGNTEGGEATGPAAFWGKRDEEDYRFSGSSFFFSFFCLAGFSAFSAFAEGSALAAFLAGFFSGSAGLSSAFDFSTSSRMAIGALSPTRFCTWTMRVYPPGRVLKRGAMESNSFASAA